MKIAGTLPKGHGLSQIEKDMVAEPHQMRTVIALIDCKKITTDNDTDEVEATVRIRRIEVVIDQDEDAAQRLLRRALDARNGGGTLIFDGDTGEIVGDDE